MILHPLSYDADITCPIKTSSLLGLHLAFGCEVLSHNLVLFIARHLRQMWFDTVIASLFVSRLDPHVVQLVKEHRLVDHV